MSDTMTNAPAANGAGDQPASAGHAAGNHTRMDYQKADPAAVRAMMGLETYVRGSGLEHSLLELVKLRASVMNGCAYCVDMHTKDARVAGETEQRLYAVPVWREGPFFTPRERAALEWTEALTDLSAGVPDGVYERALAEFGEQGLMALSMAVVAINGWNRLAIGFRAPVGTYQPPQRRQAHAQPEGAGAA